MSTAYDRLDLSRALVAGMVLLAASAATATGQQATADTMTWKKHSFAEERFEVEFPGPIRSEPLKLDPATRKKVVRSTQHIQIGSDFVLIVGAQQNVDAVNFEAGAQGSFNTLNCLTREADVPLPLASGRGREIKGKNCMDNTMRVEARYFEQGPWFYQLIAIVPVERETDPTVQRFLNSFKITAP